MLTVKERHVQREKNRAKLFSKHKKKQEVTSAFLLKPSAPIFAESKDENRIKTVHVAGNKSLGYVRANHIIPTIFGFNR